MKKYHLAHHYKNFDLGYGVTSASLLLSFMYLMGWRRQDVGLCLQHCSPRLKSRMSGCEEGIYLFLCLLSDYRVCCFLEEWVNLVVIYLIRNCLCFFMCDSGLLLLGSGVGIDVSVGCGHLELTIDV